MRGKCRSFEAKCNMGSSPTSEEARWIEAVSYGDAQQVARLLGARPDFVVVEVDGLPPLHAAAKRGHDQVVAELLAVNPGLMDAVDSQQSIALHHACKAGHLVVVKQLLAAKPCLLDTVDSDGCTALHHAAQFGFDQIVAELLRIAADTSRLSQDVPLISRVIRRGNWTALHLAANVGYAGVVKELLAASPESVLVTGFSNWNALHCASRRSHDHIVRLLLDSAAASGHLSALVTAVDCMGWTSLHHAVCFSRDKIVVQLLAVCPELVDKLNSAGATALHFAVNNSMPETTSELLLACSTRSAHVVDIGGNTPLHAAITSQHRRVEFIDRLWKLNTNALHLVNCLSETPFHLAVKYAQLPLIDLFQWQLSIDEIVSAYVEYQKIDDFILRYRPIATEQCEWLSHRLNQDVLGIVFEYLAIPTNTKTLNE